MHLMRSTTSPFGRLAHAMLIEAGGAFDVELLNPWADPPQLVALNPAKRVPTLRLDDGTVLTEAMVIAMYAADIAPEGSHLKQNTPAQYEIMGLAFGAMEAAVYIMTGRKIISDDLAKTEFDAHPVAERRRQTMRVALCRLDGMTDRLREDRL
ncbi:MAG: glutathione S-transferase N-terminal domain-containing protein, partial [Hyphomicrobiales bacterium]|nr:glutathione S-transferase N-terminal domain-containing protein [Hyphomicrobiales bacterium]